MGWISALFCPLVWSLYVVNELLQDIQKPWPDTLPVKRRSYLFCEPPKVAMGISKKKKDIHTHIHILYYTESNVPCLEESLLYQQSQILSLEILRRKELAVANATSAMNVIQNGLRMSVSCGEQHRFLGNLLWFVTRLPNSKRQPFRGVLNPVAWSAGGCRQRGPCQQLTAAGAESPLTNEGHERHRLSPGSLLPFGFLHFPNLCHPLWN